MTKKRYLTKGEIDLLSDIFGDREYFQRTTIERGNWYIGSNYGMVSNNNIKVGKVAYSDDFSKTAPAWFVHEGAHLVQEQTFGRHLARSKTIDKAKDLFRNNYRYMDDIRRGVPFEKMAIEAQASMISDYYRAVQGKPGRYATLPIETYQQLIPESFVPSFGRSSEGVPDSENWTDQRKVGNTNIVGKPRNKPKFNQDQRIDVVPRAKPESLNRIEFPLSDKPLIPGAQEVLPPTFQRDGKLIRNQGVPKRTRVEKQAGHITNVGSGLPGTRNPFRHDVQNLMEQSKLLERNPALARHMILAAGRDPSLFRL